MGFLLKYSFFRFFYKLYKIYLGFINLSFTLLPELRKAETFVNSSKKNIIFVFDLSCSGIRIGHMLLYVFLGRYFYYKKKKVFFIITGNYKHNKHFSYYNKKEFQYYMDIFKLLIKSVVSNNTPIHFINWETVKKKFLDNKNYYIVFKDRVLKRNRIDNKIHFFLNNLIGNESSNFLKKILLNQNTFKKGISKKIKKFSKEKYICLHIRYDKKLPQNRNISRKFLIKICNSIKQYFPEFNLLIISNKDGTIFAKKIISNFKIKKIFFSHDLSNKNEIKKFFIDLFLLLNSSLTIKTNYSGGIITALWYSLAPFIHYGYSNDKFRTVWKDHLSLNKMYKWNNELQTLYHEYKYISDDYIFKILQNESIKRNLN